MYPELQLLGRWTRSASSLGNQGADTVWSPPPTMTNDPNLPQGKLNGTQVGAVAYVVVHSPVDGGTIEDLNRVQLVLDGKPYSLIWFFGRKDYLTAPDPRKVEVGSPLWLGEPPYTDQDGPAGPLQNTAPKFIDSVTVNAYAGDTAITQDYTVEIWGWTYHSVKLAGLMPSYGGQSVVVSDILSGKSFTVNVPSVAAAGDWRGAWTALPGGPQQGSGNGTPIHKFIRRARNANATTAGETYIPQYENSSLTPAVEFADDNLYFTLNARQALLLEGWGVDGPSAPNSGGYDLKAAWIQTPAEGDHQRHPRGGRPADYQLGTTRFGLIPGATDRYAGIPLLDAPLLATDETAYLTFVDNGTSVPAKNVAMTVVGTLLGPDGQGGV